MKTTIEATCPYCGIINLLDWEVGNSVPQLIQCGFKPITHEPFKGCLKRFVVKVEWITNITVQAIQGEGDVLRGGE